MNLYLMQIPHIFYLYFRNYKFNDANHVAISLFLPCGLVFLLQGVCLWSPCVVQCSTRVCDMAYLPPMDSLILEVVLGINRSICWCNRNRLCNNWYQSLGHGFEPLTCVGGDCCKVCSLGLLVLCNATLEFVTWLNCLLWIHYLWWLYQALIGWSFGTMAIVCVTLFALVEEFLSRMCTRHIDIHTPFLRPNNILAPGIYRGVTFLVSCEANILCQPLTDKK